MVLPSCGRHSDSSAFFKYVYIVEGKNQQSKLIEDRCAVKETLPGLIKVSRRGVIKQNVF